MRKKSAHEDFCPLLCYIHNMGLSTFPFTLRTPGGQEYRVTVPAATADEAERILKSVLEGLESRDRIVMPAGRSVKADGPPFSRAAGKRNYHLFKWADKSAIYKDR